MRPHHRLATAHDRVLAERRRRERWHDLRAALGVLAVALLVLRWLPAG